MVVLLFIQVVRRYGFENPPDWTEELARAVFIYCHLRRRCARRSCATRHLRIEACTDGSRRGEDDLDIGMLSIGDRFLCRHALLQHRPAGAARAPAYDVGADLQGVVFAAVPIGCALMLVYELLRVRNYLRALRDHGKREA
jgi:TRAP-type C4-dicarboxylate transport system permease small subunit